MTPDKILETIGVTGTLDIIERDIPGAQFYRLRKSDGDLLVRLEKNKNRYGPDMLAHWLKTQGVHVNAPLDGYPKEADGWFLTAYPWLETRTLQPGDMAAFGATLRTLHNTLARHPNASQWRAQTDKDLLALSGIRAKIASGELKVGPYADGLAELARDDDNDFVMHGAPRIACHMGRALWDTKEQRIVFFKFKNVPHAFLPPGFELARAIELHILQPKADLVHAREFLTGYGVDGKLHLARIMTANVVRACCALAGSKAAPDQWQKIFDLYDLIQRKRPELDALES